MSSLKFCPKCGAELKLEMDFCPICGADLAEAEKMLLAAEAEMASEATEAVTAEAEMAEEPRAVDVAAADAVEKPEATVPEAAGETKRPKMPSISFDLFNKGEAEGKSGEPKERQSISVKMPDIDTEALKGNFISFFNLDVNAFTTGDEFDPASTKLSEQSDEVVEKAFISLTGMSYAQEEEAFVQQQVGVAKSKLVEEEVVHETDDGGSLFQVSSEDEPDEDRDDPLAAGMPKDWDLENPSRFTKRAELPDEDEAASRSAASFIQETPKYDDAPMIIPAPVTYAEWTDCFDIIAKGGHDKDVIEAMDYGTFDLSGLVGENFYDAFAAALRERAERKADEVKRRFAPLNMRSSVEEEKGFILETIQDYKAEMQVLLRMTSVPAVPGEGRMKLGFMLAGMATELQASVTETLNERCAYDLAEIVLNNPFNS